MSTDGPNTPRESTKSEDSSLADRRGRRLPISCRLFFFGENEFEGEAGVLDISTNGCQATTLETLTPGMVLRLSVFLGDQQWPLRIDEAVVRWVNGQNFGLEFSGIRTAQRERLRTLIMKAKL